MKKKRVHYVNSPELVPQQVLLSPAICKRLAYHTHASTSGG